MKKISILGILAIISTPAMAENVPDSGVMTNNTTYTESCNNTTLGTYTGPANMTAQYRANTYNCPGGQYLVVGDANTEPKCETCPTGSYCPGTGSVTYTDNMTNTGITSCPSGYANSDAGAASDGACYTSCALNQVAHATSVSGKSYNNGTNTCSATGCENGWHVGKSETPDLKGITSAGKGQTANDSEGLSVVAEGMSNSIIEEDPLAFAVDYGNDLGVIKGHGRCSSREGKEARYDYRTYNIIDYNFVDGLDDETRQYGAEFCYCQLDSYSVGGKTTALSGPWVFTVGYASAYLCADDCAANCAVNMQADYEGDLAFRAAVFGSLGASPAICEANTIDIQWDGVTDAGDAATCSYSGDLKTPATAPTKKGYTFTGWKVNK